MIAAQTLREARMSLEIDFHDKITDFTEGTLNDGVQIKIKFTNGWTASLVKGPYTYGGPEGLWEMGVFNPGGDLDYCNPITSGDVQGWLSDARIEAKLRRLASFTNEQLQTYADYAHYLEAVRRVQENLSQIENEYQQITNVYYSEDDERPVDLKKAFTGILKAFEAVAIEDPEIAPDDQEEEEENA
jgi:hypothetical protein